MIPPDWSRVLATFAALAFVVLMAWLIWSLGMNSAD